MAFPRHRVVEYKCTRCQRSADRGELTVKQARFYDIGKQSPKRTRTVAWLCGECLELDTEWKRVAYSDSPGITEQKTKAASA